MMKLRYLGIVVCATLMGTAGCQAQVQNGNTPTTVHAVVVDSLQIVKLGAELNALKPLDPAAFKAKFSKEINGLPLTEVDAFLDEETGAYCTALYKKGDKSVYLMVTDGAGQGSAQVAENLLNFLEIKKLEEPGDKTNIKPYQGYEAYFDHSMYESDQLTSIQYVAGNRFLVVASGNQIPLDELQQVLDQVRL